MRMKTRVAWGVGLAAAVMGACRGCREIVPDGASPAPWLIARVEGAAIRSPEGVELRVAYNDAGAAHSGRHGVWVMRYSRWTGWRVVAGGFVDGHEREGGPSMLKVEWGEGRVRVWCAREKLGEMGWAEGEY